MTAPTYPRIDREIAEHGAHIMGYLDALPMEIRRAVLMDVLMKVEIPGWRNIAGPKKGSER